MISLELCARMLKSLAPVFFRVIERRRDGRPALKVLTILFKEGEHARRFVRTGQSEEQSLGLDAWDFARLFYHSFITRSSFETKEMLAGYGATRARFRSETRPPVRSQALLPPASALGVGDSDA